MKTSKSIIIAALIAATSGVAQAQRIEQPVEQYGRSVKPAGVQSTIAPSMSGEIDVALVQGRASNYMRPAASTGSLVTERSVNLYGRS